MAHPQAFSLRVNANPLAGGNTDGPAEPVPWCLLEGCLALCALHGKPYGFTTNKGGRAGV